MQLIFYKTRHHLLQKYLKGYYFIEEDKQLNNIRYLTFPSNYTILSVSHRADVLLEEGRITVMSSPTKGISTDIVFKHSVPIEVYYAQAVNEITFYFHPLGINRFISEVDFSCQPQMVMNYIVAEDFNEKMLAILTLQERSLQIEAIEEYWLSKLQDKDYTFMEKLVYEVEHSNNKLDDLAQQFHITRQYISKLFLRHLGKSPAMYRKIHRFRSSIERKQEWKNLTALCYDHLFYDQSHFIKDFKKFTGSKPKSFFNKVDTEKENIWLFIN